MATWSVFCSYFVQNRKNLPASLASDIRQEALSRYRKRIQAGRADFPLLFDDLIGRCEASIAGK